MSAFSPFVDGGGGGGCEGANRNLFKIKASSGTARLVPRPAPVAAAAAAAAPPPPSVASAAASVAAIMAAAAASPARAAERMSEREAIA